MELSIFPIHYQAYSKELNCGIMHLQVDMEQELQVDQTIVLGDLTSTNPKEVGFQILLLSCCKETFMLLENAFHFYG